MKSTSSQSSMSRISDRFFVGGPMSLRGFHYRVRHTSSISHSYMHLPTGYWSSCKSSWWWRREWRCVRWWCILYSCSIFGFSNAIFVAFCEQIWMIHSSASSSYVSEWQLLGLRGQLFANLGNVTNWQNVKVGSLRNLLSETRVAVGFGVVVPSTVGRMEASYSWILNALRHVMFRIRSRKVQDWVRCDVGSHFPWTIWYWYHFLMKTSGKKWAFIVIQCFWAHWYYRATLVQNNISTFRSEKYLRRSRFLLDPTSMWDFMIVFWNDKEGKSVIIILKTLATFTKQAAAWIQCQIAGTAFSMMAVASNWISLSASFCKCCKRVSPSCLTSELQKMVTLLRSRCSGAK